MKRTRAKRIPGLRLFTLGALLGACFASTADSLPVLGPAGTDGNGTQASPASLELAGFGTGKSEVLGVRWEDIEKLIEEQRYRAALESAERLLDSARGAADEDEWARALVLVARLETGLHGYESAVRRLKSERWPEGLIPRTAVELYYAHGLAAYRRIFGWEIERREKSVADDQFDLGAWTGRQILREVDSAFSSMWEQREDLGTEPLGALEPYLVVNNYPRSIRGTVRDALAYLWVELLADSSLWSPAEHQDLYFLDVAGLLSGKRLRDDVREPAETEWHPLARTASILGDLEGWHRSGGRDEAALEARLERVRRIGSHLSQVEDRRRLRAELESLLETTDRSLPWWSTAAADLAESLRSGEDPWRLVAARDVARRGWSEHPQSAGGQRCLALVAELEAPAFTIAAMATDGLERRSIEVRHKNVTALYFRAFRVDLADRVQRSDDFDLLPNRREIERELSAGSPDFEWSVSLEQTPDLDYHRSFVIPRIEAAGMYLIVASARQDFAEDRNHLEAVYLNLSDLVLAERRSSKGLEVTVLSGSTGRTVADAEVRLYAYDWKEGSHRLIAREESDREGRALFSPHEGDEPFFVIASYRGEIALDRTVYGLDTRPGDRLDRSALIYTDRSVYRPGQWVAWKVVAYEGRSRSGSFETLPGSMLTVELLDANFEVIESVEVETNEFGSASGRFDIPRGRLLGSWTVRTSLGGSSRVQVEEYKRPTFDVEIRDAGAPLRLNRPARLTGSARYYFGMPLVGGEVRWRVTRLPVYPRRWWYPEPPETRERAIASGRTALDPDGGFEIEFLPSADERESESGVSFRYRVIATVTDTGGETRSGERQVRVGFTAVEAVIDEDRRFFGAGQPIALGIMRRDLDGTARPGMGRWRLAELARPEVTPLPADLPLDAAPLQAGRRPPYRTVGDDQRPRWQVGGDPLRFMSFWPDGGEVAVGETRHDSEGRAEISLPTLPAGAYRLLYETEDDYGDRFRTGRDFVVVEDRISLEVPIALWAERSVVRVGEKVRFFVHSGLPGQELVLELLQGAEVLERRPHVPERDGSLVEIEIGRRHRGGISARLSGVRDHQTLSSTTSVFVPWDDQSLSVSFSSFRDRIRPGDQERWSVVVSAADDSTLARASVEALAYMYDRSLDLFAPHQPPDPMRLYPRWGAPRPVALTLGASYPTWRSGRIAVAPRVVQLEGDRLRFFDGHGTGGMGYRSAESGVAEMVAVGAAPPEPGAEDELEAVDDPRTAGRPVKGPAADSREPRSNFSETAFWIPHLRLGKDGSVSFDFSVPDSLTEWSVWVHALTSDLRSGSVERRTVSSKELMVRPYLPRFLREGDEVELRIVINNAGHSQLSGVLDLALRDEQSGEDLASKLGLERESLIGIPFSIEAGGTATIPFKVQVPSRVGELTVTAEARAGAWSDGERRVLPFLPGRFHLMQSKFVALEGEDRRRLHFAEMEADDPTRFDERLITTIDAQLFQGVLAALPYLDSYPYDCTEQTLNRFLSSAVILSAFADHPALRGLAGRLADRGTRLEPWDLDDPNRRMLVEESPWTGVAAGLPETGAELINLLDQKMARDQRDSALADLEEAQTASGGFPWWPGGPPSPYMTLYLLSGLSRALEFGVEVPRPMIERAWAYLHRHYLDEEIVAMTGEDCCWEMVTFLNYVLSSYPDESWSGGYFGAVERQRMLDFSLAHWRAHPPLLKGYLALTLQREGRVDEAKRVLESIMDSARSDPDLGTYWAPEERSWLWYNDTIESHAFALRALLEIDSSDERRHGLVKWLFLNKKLNQWKSTRATAEVIYAMAHYLSGEGVLGEREIVEVTIGERPPRRLIFEPGESAPGKRQIVLDAAAIETPGDGSVIIEKRTPGMVFAAATWHFSTKKPPKKARGDLFSVERTYFRRRLEGTDWVLHPLDSDASIEVGDQIEVQLRIRSASGAEYVHLRDPRPAGLEPETLTSGYSWQFGISWYEEVRDSGTNFFFEWLPAGEYVLGYRLRATLAGSFNAAPAELQSMYAPEFSAYSAGSELVIGE